MKKDADRFIIVTALIANNFEKKFGRQKKRKKIFQETGPKSKCVCECGVCYAKGRRRHPRFLRIECVRNATLGRLTHTAKGIEPFSPLRECLNARTGQASPGVCDPDRTFEFPKAKKKRRKEREVKKKKKKRRPCTASSLIETGLITRIAGSISAHESKPLRLRVLGWLGEVSAGLPQTRWISMLSF